MNEKIWLLWYLRSTFFHSFFGKNWRYEKEISKSNDLPLAGTYTLSPDWKNNTWVLPPKVDIFQQARGNSNSSIISAGKSKWSKKNFCLEFRSVSSLLTLPMDNLYTGQLSRHFFFWQLTILRLTQITPWGWIFGPWFFIVLKNSGQDLPNDKRREEFQKYFF